MADELLYNEDQIKNQIGAYRPHFNPVTKTYDPVIKCWPLEDFKGQFNQEREVIPGMENEVYDIALATIQDNIIEYKETPVTWNKGTLDNYNILIYTPKLDNNIDNWFSKYRGICTYIYLVGNSVTKSGKWDNKKYW